MKYLPSKYTIGAVFATIVFLCTIFLAVIKEHDASFQSTVVCNKKLPGDVWLVSYAGGGDVHFQNQRYLTESALNKCIDFYKPYNADHIDSDYKKAHANILSQKKGDGYWLWKPYLILKTLEEIPEDDIVFYVDSGASISKPIDSLINHLTDHDIVAFAAQSINRKYIKRDLLLMMEADNDWARDNINIQASFFLIKNTKFSRDFVKKWLKLCEDERAVTDLPSKDEHPEFIVHRHDQSILSLLSLQYPEKFYILPFEKGRGDYFFHHRRRQETAGQPLTIWKYMFDMMAIP